MRVLLGLLVFVVLCLHQDTWFWKSRELVFGFLPVGLAYHAGFSVVATIIMALLVKFLWPSHLEVDEKDYVPMEAE
ncbi:MAG: DUF3311 domain-containing protein [Armatimonadetes bacterium]|nr:DUF3311 domain-containing protein [Armatimonadota bacterium]